MNISDLPTVAGRMECSNAEFEHRCLAHLEEEQQKLLPDTALIALLCDAVRCVREYSEAMQGQPLELMPTQFVDRNNRPEMTVNWMTDLVRMSAYRIHQVIGSNIQHYRTPTEQELMVVVQRAIERNKS